MVQRLLPMTGSGLVCPADLHRCPVGMELPEVIFGQDPRVDSSNVQGLLWQKEALHGQHLAAQGAAMIRVICQDLVIGSNRWSIISVAAVDISPDQQHP